MKLSEQQIEQFDEEGFLVIENALQDSDLDPVIREYEEYVDRRAREWHAAGRISQLYEHEPFERRLACICKENTEIYHETDNFMDIMDVLGKATFDFLRNDHLLDLVEGIVGPEITCSPIQHIRAKLPSDMDKGLASNVAPWHQDAQVHLEEADPYSILTVWLPLCAATPENGCLQIIPRIHKKEMVYWSPGFGISEETLPEGEVLTLPMKKGSVLLMHKLIPHSSTPNYTDGIRWSMDLRYQKAGTPTGRSFYPDFVVRSHADPDAVLDDYAEWCRLWIAALEKIPTNKRPGRKTRPEGPSPLRVER